MTERWQHQPVTLTCAPPYLRPTVEAHVYGALAVHRTTHMPWTRARWSVTHVPTGLHVSTANTERLARRFVREVSTLVDWEQPGDLKTLTAEFWTGMAAAMLRAHASGRMLVFGQKVAS